MKKLYVAAKIWLLKHNWSDSEIEIKALCHIVNRPLFNICDEFFNILIEDEFLMF